jgi:post-segregation antitoxin (ccd killing protein)
VPYARVDDRYDDHPKIKRAWRRAPAAVGLHSMAITYANRHETDGLVDVEWMDEKLALMAGKPGERKRTLEVLLELGLLERVDANHYRLHDFLDWNVSRAQREALRAAGRKGANARWHQPPGEDATRNGRSDTDRITDGNGEGAEVANGPPLHASPLLEKNPQTPASGGQPENQTNDRRNPRAKGTNPRALARAATQTVLSPLEPGDEAAAERVHGEMRKAVSESSYGIWLDGAGPVGRDGDTVVWATPSTAKMSWASDRFGPVLETCAASVGLVARWEGPADVRPSEEVAA